MANEEQVTKLRVAIGKGRIEIWNKWRNKNLQSGPDLTGVDLSGSKLSGANLTAADLRKARRRQRHRSPVAALRKSAMNNSTH